ncbi:hypothetical protein [Streptomyces sp. NPDC023838]|uniref:hypothetical protein n=1 Tax=Streptomyces sp. NPDC023838 TaxID=3154325 RepID=UPI0034047A85
MDECFVGEADERSADTVITPVKRRRMTELSDKRKASNKVHAALRAPSNAPSPRPGSGESCGNPVSARMSPNKLTSVAAAILTLVIYM